MSTFIDFETTTLFSATVTTDGTAVTDATVTITITGDGGTLADGASMTHAGSGVYEYSLASNSGAAVGESYTAEVVAVDGSNTSTAYVDVIVVQQR